jgi:membrane carboxypeptidase/penicillin-binding protein PbpC
MKKLDDLTKKLDYKVPEGYFDSLPGRIQSRVTSGKSASWRFNLGFSMRYALPLVALVAVGIVWYNRANESMYEQLEKIDENQLTWFLDESDLTSEELADNVTWSTEDLDALEEEVFNAMDESGEGLDIVIDELDLENF